jgi:HAD superfamily hydrolase (TIGR01662 family)
VAGGRLTAPVRAVVFDVDFTIGKPGPLLGPEGYRFAGTRHGLDLDPALYDRARATAIEELEHHPELDHDETVWIRFTERIVAGMGGSGPGVSALSIEIVRAWERSENFELYEDVPPVLRELRRHGLRIGLLSNTGHGRLERLVGAFSLDVDAVLASGTHGKTKPSPTIFAAVLELLGTEAHETVMVGDTLLDDVEGARAVGMRAFLVDREGLHGPGADRLPDLYALPRALGLR